MEAQDVQREAPRLSSVAAAAPVLGSMTQDLTPLFAAGQSLDEIVRNVINAISLITSALLVGFL